MKDFFLDKFEYDYFAMRYVEEGKVIPYTFISYKLLSDKGICFCPTF